MSRVTLHPQPAESDRTTLLAWYRANRARSAYLFGLIDDTGYTQRPIPLRHPFAFYHGHLPAFSYSTLNERTLGETPLDTRLERLFERGIDPASLDGAARLTRDDWPMRAEIAAFGRACDARVEAAITRAQFDERFALAVSTILEHELMHHETLMYIVNCLDQAYKRYVAQTHSDPVVPTNESVSVAPGVATLGVARDATAFGWDNEFDEHCVRVDAFGMQRFPITNGDWLRFVAAGGPIPPFWIERDGAWLLRATFEELPLPHSWPVYVSHAQASAYAEWIGMRLPTEPEFHRATFGTRDGRELHFPWGESQPQPRFGNFDFSRYDPEPVNAHPAGASAWGIEDLVGNGWEWTNTLFAPFPGFEPMASYPQYSTDFFDGAHYVLKGASAVTSRHLIRRSFRNWFYDEYPYAFAKFRCVNGQSGKPNSRVTSRHLG